jgi:hypothetical protein
VLVLFLFCSCRKSSLTQAMCYKFGCYLVQAVVEVLLLVHYHLEIFFVSSIRFMYDVVFLSYIIPRSSLSPLHFSYSKSLVTLGKSMLV